MQCKTSKISCQYIFLTSLRLESYRNESGKPRVRVIASLGRLDKIQKTKKIDPLINGLARAAGRAPNRRRDIVYELATEHGSLFARNYSGCIMP